jgi:uncharacterized protein (TIGR03435 family)
MVLERSHGLVRIEGRRLSIVSFVASFAVLAVGFSQSKELSFAVSSIRPLGARRGPAPFAGEVIHPGGTFRDPGTTLRVLIDMAYDVDDGNLKIVGLPDWAEATAYAINATAGPDYPANLSKAQNEHNVKAMVRSMLADRFKLGLHQEKRETQVLMLEARKSKDLKPSPKPTTAGPLGWSVDDSRIRLRGEQVTIAQLARSLSLSMQKRVVDNTGLKGYYSFDESWDAPRRGGEPPPVFGLGSEGQAQLLSILEQNLGLLVRPKKVKVDFWVVDHVEMPSEN